MLQFRGRDCARVVIFLTSMITITKLLLPAIVASALLSGCYTPATNYVQANSDNLTLGAAQLALKKGMSQAEVVSALGSPNMVTRDKNGVETWVYDKSSTEAIATHNGATGTVLLLTVESTQSAQKTSQRTLTLILKFKDAVLTDFTCRSTSF